MEKSLGLVEVTGLSSAVETADAMIKAANVELIGLEAARGSGMMTVKVIGDVGAVKAAVEDGKACAMTFGALVSFDVIARPIESTGDMFVRTAGDTASPMFYYPQPQATPSGTETNPGSMDDELPLEKDENDNGTDIVVSKAVTEVMEPVAPSEDTAVVTSKKSVKTASRATRSRARRKKSVDKAKSSTKTGTPEGVKDTNNSNV